MVMLFTSGAVWVIAGGSKLSMRKVGSTSPTTSRVAMKMIHVEMAQSTPEQSKGNSLPKCKRFGFTLTAPVAPPGDSRRHRSCLRAVAYSTVLTRRAAGLKSSMMA